MVKPMEVDCYCDLTPPPPPGPAPRVYVIDADEKPVGCATCTDVLRAVLAASDAAS